MIQKLMLILGWLNPALDNRAMGKERKIGTKKFPYGNNKISRDQNIYSICSTTVDIRNDCTRIRSAFAKVPVIKQVGDSMYISCCQHTRSCVRVQLYRSSDFFLTTAGSHFLIRYM